MSKKKSKKNKISASENFVKIVKGLPDKPSRKYPEEDSDQLKVLAFISNFLKVGMDSNVLRGKNVPSHNVPKDDPQWLAKVRYAQEHNLWHYHIGIPFYEDEGKGYLTSEFVLHYQKLEDGHIKLVDFGWHPPMVLPKETEMAGDMILGESD